jgi:ATP-dependent RNA helicase RhlE
MTFETLGLAAGILRAVSVQGYDEPTPIQSQAIPAVLAGRVVMASAQTGTGKTAAFTLPLLDRLVNGERPPGQRAPRALVLTPTRELAAQVADSITSYGKYIPLKSAVVYGGVKIHPQIQKLRRGVDVLVATPGRLLDHVGQNTVDLSHVQMLVLDEADRMLDMGFIHDIRRLLKCVPEQRQTLLFSATFSRAIRQLADDLMTDPVRVEVARENSTADNISQVIHPVDRQRKRELLSFMIGDQNWEQVLVFTRTKHGANRLAEQLAKDGLATAAIHGNKSQGARSRALRDFKKGAVRVLVATDIAARGLDIDHLPHVVNYELPNVSEDYVHRIGRTGRAGKSGRAVSLVCVEEYPLLHNIERLLKQDLPKTVVPGYEPDGPLPHEAKGNRRRPPQRRRSSNAAPSRRRNSSRDGVSGEGRPSRSSRPKVRSPRAVGGSR